MNKQTSSALISVVVPLYNEADGIISFLQVLCAKLDETWPHYEIILVDDGSTDSSNQLLVDYAEGKPDIQLIGLSRNFGKESALSAGIAVARGEAIVMIDADGQHPPEVIGDLLKKWQAGAQVVIGVREPTGDEAVTKRLGSRVFYSLLNAMGVAIVPRSTDFRLIDREVADAFLSLDETDRITRGLIDWLGFERDYVTFTPKVRSGGAPTYNLRKLLALFTNSFTSLTLQPLYMFGYLGLVITSVALLAGIVVFTEQIILGDMWNWNFTGTAMLGILTVFLVGVLLLAQGILALYLGHMYSQTLKRPLYIINSKKSKHVARSDKTQKTA